MRLSALIAALLVTVLAVALLPAAVAQEVGDPTRSGPAVVPDDAWTPGDLDLDWADFAAAHRGQYQQSSWASAQDPAAEAAVRRELHAQYAQATGAEGASFAQTDPQRTDALAKQYYDECDDGSNLADGGVQASREGLYRGGANSAGGVSYNPAPGAPPPLVDLRSTFIVQTADDLGRFDQTGFLFYACDEFTFEQLGDGGIAFGLYVTYEDEEEEYPTVLGDPEVGPDFVVAIYPVRGTNPQRYEVIAVRTPSRDRGTWTLTHLGGAERLDGYEIDGVVPTSAIGDFTADSGFAWTVEVVDSQQPGGRDWFPERNWQLRVGSGPEAEVGTHIPQFPVPDDCGLQGESTDKITYELTPQAVTPDDEGYQYQWAHRHIDTPQGWDVIRDSSLGGRSRPVTVAVVDTGIDATRFDFLDGGPRITAGLDAVYGLELEGPDNGGTIGPFLGPTAPAYESFGTTAVPRNSDRDPHGTGVASILGARGNNTFGIAGVDWGVRMMPIRVNDANGCISNVVVAEGIKWAVDHGADIVHISLGAPETELFTPEDGDVDTPECSDGIDNDRDGATDFQPPAGAAPDLGCEDAQDGSEGVDVTAGGDGGLDPATACTDGRDNDADGDLDLDDEQCVNAEDDFEGNDGESVEFDPLRETIDYALEKGVAVVAAAGNFGSQDDPVIYPAAYPGVITVGASDRTADRAFYSSTGRWLDVLAPGGNNSKTLAQDIAVLWELDRIRSAAGTSFAAPQVTGALSLYLGLNPHLAREFVPLSPPLPAAGNYPACPVNPGCYQRQVDDLRVALQHSALDLRTPGHDILTGYGLLDVDRMFTVEPFGGPLADPARGQLPRTNADSVIEASEEVALSRPLTLPPYVVFTRSDVAVDALAGAPLLKGGPLLVAGDDGVADSTMGVLGQLMPEGGTAYLLGGEAALPAVVEDQLRAAGYDPVRLAGPSRVETAVAVADEVRRLWPGTDQVAVARADGGDNPTAQWADALTGGAWAASTSTPLVVTGGDALHPAVAEALERWGTSSTVVLGGEVAVGEAVLAALPQPSRIAGEDRASTAVAIAEQLWDDEDGYVLVNGYYARGWVAGLAAAGWAADEGRAMLYTGADGVPAATAALLGRACPAADDLRIVGGASLVTGTAEAALVEAAAC